MASEWDSGFLTHKPSWHRGENLLAESPKDWSSARTAGGLLWEAETEPVYAKSVFDPQGPVYTDYGPQYSEIDGWQAIVRNDKKPGDPRRTLALQKDSYAVIKNADLGDVVDTLLGLEPEETKDIAGLMSLYGGRKVVCLVKFANPLPMSWDPGHTYKYLAVVSRHDGEGSLNGLYTNVRVECANTLSWAESMDGPATGWSIRHTSNWEDRLAEVARGLQQVQGDSRKWLEFAEQLAMWKATSRQRDTYLKRLMPVADDMTQLMVTNRMVARDQVRQILDSSTCEHIYASGYGLLMATTEWSDHFRRANHPDSAVSRSLLHKEEWKTRGSKILRQMAGIKA